MTDDELLDLIEDGLRVDLARKLHARQQRLHGRDATADELQMAVDVIDFRQDAEHILQTLRGAGQQQAAPAAPVPAAPAGAGNQAPWWCIAVEHPFIIAMVGVASVVIAGFFGIEGSKIQSGKDSIFWRVPPSPSPKTIPTPSPSPSSVPKREPTAASRR